MGRPLLRQYRGRIAAWPPTSKLSGITAAGPPPMLPGMPEGETDLANLCRPASPPAPTRAAEFYADRARMGSQPLDTTRLRMLERLLKSAPENGHQPPLEAADAVDRATTPSIRPEFKVPPGPTSATRPASAASPRTSAGDGNSPYQQVVKTLDFA